MIRVIEGDCRAELAAMADKSVHCCVTSPPYFGLRDYGTGTWEGGDPGCEHIVGEIRTGLGMAKLGERYRGGGHKVSDPDPIRAANECPSCGAVRTDPQIGLEPTIEGYIAEMVALFRQIRRVLRDDGTVWLNLGDSYTTGTKAPRNPTTIEGPDVPASWSGRSQRERVGTPVGLKTKDLMMMPARVAIALQADGWYLRKDIIWFKPNPMPESVTDRPTSSHEHVFLLAKAERYFYDAEAVRETAVAKSLHDMTGTESGNRVSNGNSQTFRGGGAYTSGKAFDNDGASERDSHGHRANETGDRNLRDVWTIATHPFPEAHFATFPPDLVIPCIKAGTSETGACPTCGAPWVRTITKGEPDLAHQMACGGDATGEYHGQSTKGHAAAGVQDASALKSRVLAGMRKKTYGWQPTCDCPEADPVQCVVLDPFGGAGTTGLVADRLGRSAILIELNPDYAEIARKRIKRDAGLFAEVFNE